MTQCNCLGKMISHTRGSTMLCKHFSWNLKAKDPVAEYVEPEPSAWGNQVGGEHYKNLPIQPSEYIIRNGLGWFSGNVLKYITRYHLKGGLQDLKKARHYLDLLIEEEEKSSE